jgi:hypothetical protein
LLEYCVDEAGDSVLWNRRGKLLVGTEGCSRYFILGMVCVRDAEKLATEAQELRERLLADPYFRGVPSMDPEKGRTAAAFHAKDDPSEVRRDFFSLLLQHDIEFHAVVRAKMEAARIVSDFRTLHPDYVYNQNQLYDHLARRLFHGKLRREGAYSIVFARRGMSDRTSALLDALVAAQYGHGEADGIAEHLIQVQAASPKDRIELQAVDYYLWALQRAYEKGEDRYIRMMWQQVHCVWDYDDTGESKTGVLYTQEKPLTAASILRG